MSARKPILHTRSEIEHELRWRRTPRTDNRNALLELGFTPAYPHLANDAYYGGLWTRAVSQNGSPAVKGLHSRSLVTERAFHICAESRPRRLRLRRAVACAVLQTPSRTYHALRARRFAGVAKIRHAAKALVSTGASQLRSAGDQRVHPQQPSGN